MTYFLAPAKDNIKVFNSIKHSSPSKLHMGSTFPDFWVSAYMFSYVPVRLSILLINGY
ncbi:hypothetical protein [Aeromonas phage Akh-2]|nr:hypothetical protein [Aeromonas phage Akh-2]